MFDHLGFLVFLNKELKTKENTYALLSKWFNITERTIKGNCLVLNANSTDNREVYKADEYILTVKEDFLKIV